jgi:hypothetical protein
MVAIGLCNTLGTQKQASLVLDLMFIDSRLQVMVTVTDGREGVCVDPGERDAILGTGGPAPPGKGEGQQ